MKQWLHPANNALLLTESVLEMEGIEQVVQGRTIGRYIRVVGLRRRIREIIAAAGGERLQVPVPFDKFDDRNMVCIAVVDVSAG